MLVYVGQKPFRGYKHPERKAEGIENVDVTSNGPKRYAEAFSPLLIGPCLDPFGDEARFFEHLWQYSKVYPQLGHWDEEQKCPTEAWHRWRREGYPKLGKNGKGYRRPPEIYRLKERGQDWKPIGLWWDGRLLNYIESREQVYVPVYWKLVEAKVTQVIKPTLKRGEVVTKGWMVLDYDGPVDEDHQEHGMLVTVEALRAKLRDPSAPFGHGYVVAAILAGFALSDLMPESTGESSLKKVKL